MTVDRFNDPDDLCELKVECKVCGAQQRHMLRSEDNMHVALADTKCFSCGEKGRFKLARPTPRAF